MFYRKAILIGFLLALMLATTATTRAGQQSDSSSLNPLSNEQFCDSLRFRPIKFSERQKIETGYVLTGQLQTSVLVSTYQFSVSKNYKEHHFLKRDGDYAEEIDYDKFIDKCKDESWFVGYLPEKNNEIFSAQQIKSLEALGSSFAQSTDDVTQTINSLEFWERLRMKTVSFTKLINGNEIIWLFIAPYKGSYGTSQEKEEVILSDGSPIKKFRRFDDGLAIMLKSNGSFLIHEKCVFDVVDSKNSKGIITKATLGIIGKEKVRIRVKPVNRQYFLDNMTKTLWYCFYDKESQQALRMLQVPDPNAGEPAPDSIVNKDKKDNK